MNTEIDITSLIASPHFVPFDLSNNRATLGQNAGELTWNASRQAARNVQPPLLSTEEFKAQFRDFVQDSGGWNREEINAWDDEHLNTLLLQWIAGDIREAFDDADFEDWDWAQYDENQKAARVAGRIYRGDDGKVYFSISG